MSLCRSLSRSCCSAFYSANVAVSAPPSTRRDTAGRCFDPWCGGTVHCAPSRSSSSFSKRPLHTPSASLPPHDSSGHATATLDPRPPPSQTAGIRDRLRFWKFDADLKRREILSDRSHSDEVEQEDYSGIDLQAADEMLEDFDPDELDAYITQLDAAARPDGEEPEFHEATVLEVGDLVELSGASTLSSRLAVFVRCIGPTFQYYTIEGKIRLSSYQNSIFISKKFLQPHELDALHPYFPADRAMDIAKAVSIYADAVPRGVGASIVRKLVEFQARFEDAYRQYASIFDNAHDVVAHPTETCIMSLEDITSRLTGIPESELTAPLLLACSSCLLRSRVGFRVDNRLYGATRRLEIESKESAAVAYRVHQWALAYQEEKSLRAVGKEPPSDILDKSKFLKDFATRVRPLIDRSRELRHVTPDGNVLTMKNTLQLANPLHDLDTVFSPSDLDIIRYVKLFVSTKSFFYHTEIKSAGPFILRAVERYEDRNLGSETLHTLLVEIGVLQPFEDPNPLDRVLLRENSTIDAQLANIESSIQQDQDWFASAGLQDSMEHLRHDFGNLPVFCIDAANTTEVDDGISLEDIPESPGHSWLHSHIVGLPAFLGPDHVISKFAEQRHMSQYLPDLIRKMFPNWASQAFSLAPNRANPTLTISMRLDQSGNVLDTKLRAGRIHNVIRLTYDSVDANFGYNTSSDRSIIFSAGQEPGRDRGETRPPEPLQREHTEILRKIINLNSTIRQRRLANAPFGTQPGTLAISHLHVDQKGRPFSGLTVEHTSPQAQFAVEDPSISVGKTRQIEKDLLGLGRDHRPSETIVEETMLLANRYAAEWAASRNVTLPFIATIPRYGGLKLEKELLKEELEAMARGVVPYDRSTVLWFRALTSSVQVHTDPLPHRALGFPVYVKVTSPLRRFIDVVGHWNLYAAMREEVRLDRPLTAADNPDSFLPVPRALMRQHARNWVGRTTEITRYAYARRKHWLTQAAARAFYLGEHPLPSPLIAHMRHSGGDRRAAIIQELELPALTYDKIGEDGNNVFVGDYWEIRIAKILVGTRTIEVTPVRRIRSSKELERMKRAALKAREVARKEEALSGSPRFAPEAQFGHENENKAASAIGE